MTSFLCLLYKWLQQKGNTLHLKHAYIISETYPANNKNRPNVDQHWAVCEGRCTRNSANTGQIFVVYRGGHKKVK